METRLAVGVIHLDALAASEPPTQHRYCTQVLAPLFGELRRRPALRMSVAAAAVALEFLAALYPSVFDQLKGLVEEGRVEVISAGYGPMAWPLFPGVDLLRSVEMGEQAFKRLGLRPVRAFLSHEGLFGRGLEILSGHFEWAVCKDTYLRALTLLGPEPIYRLGGLGVITAAGHILTELAARAVGAERTGRPLALTTAQRAKLDDAVKAGPHSFAGAIEGSAGGSRWHWYHTGGAHHFTTRGSPGNWETFFADDAWIGLAFGHLEHLESEGWRFVTISELGSALLGGRTVAAAPEMPAVIEGGWEPRASEGTRRWTGGQRGAWPGSLATLSAVWRARLALREAETGGVDDLAADDLQRAWRSQVLAESSRGGLGPGNLRHADEVLQRIAPVVWARAAGRRPGRTADWVCADEPLTAQLLGAAGQLAWFKSAPDLYWCEAVFTSDSPDHGLRFRREPGHICYCPSGLEDRPVMLDLSSLRPQIVYLPLANGLLSLGQHSFLIRLNETCALAVAVACDDEWASFVVEGGPENRCYEWAFALFRGPLGQAVALANRLNQV